MVSKHYKRKRHRREKLIDKHLNGDGRVVDSFIIDKNHVHGMERHDLTENGVIVIYNFESGKLVTKLLARENQIKRYYKSTGKEPPLCYERILYLARWHESLGYNRT